MARGEAQRPRIAHRGAVEPREQGRRRLVVGDVRARIDIAVAGAMLERDAPLPPRRLRGRSRQRLPVRSEEHTSELQSLMRTSYAVFCLKKQSKNLTNSVHNAAIR